MNQWARRLEHIVDKLIPYSLIVLLAIIIGEIFYPSRLEPYRLLVDVLDFCVVVLFIIDLGFKYRRSKDLPHFFRSYWLEIIAVLPLFILVQLVEAFAPLARIDIVSDSAHELVGVESKYEMVVKEAQRTGHASRIVLANRLIKPLARMPRLVQAFLFYEKPMHAHLFPHLAPQNPSPRKH